MSFLGVIFVDKALSAIITLFVVPNEVTHSMNATEQNWIYKLAWFAPLKLEQFNDVARTIVC